MFRSSLGRSPTQDEIKQSMDYLMLSDKESEKEKNILFGLQQEEIKSQPRYFRNHWPCSGKINRE
jgi:hypothetical protein